MRQRRPDTSQPSETEFFAFGEGWLQQVRMQDRKKDIRIGFAMSRFKPIAVLLLLFCWAAVSAQTDAAHDQRKTSVPYKGDLSIFETPGRGEALQIDRVMDLLGIVPGKRVADIGAGSGWFTVRAAKRVTATGVVYAVDINPKAIRYIRTRAKREKLHNVKAICSKPDDPRLPTRIDAVLMLKTYHEVAHPVALLRNLRPSLHPGAKVGIIDRDGNGEDHGVDAEIVIHEANEAGYELLEHEDFVRDGMDYFLIFTAK